MVRNMGRVGEIVLELVTVLICSIVIGLGIGFLQGIFAFQLLSTKGGSAMSESATVIGGLTGLCVGPFIYYAILRSSHPSIQVVSKLIVWVTLVGMALGSLIGWTSALITPILAILLSFYLRESSRM